MKVGRGGVHLRGAGGVISGTSHAGGGTMAHVALESTTHPVESMCVEAHCGKDSRRNEDVSVRRNELELECCRPRPRDELDPHPGTVCHRIRIRFARIRIFLSSLKIVASSLRTDLIVGKQGQDDPS